MTEQAESYWKIEKLAGELTDRLFQKIGEMSMQKNFSSLGFYEKSCDPRDEICHVIHVFLEERVFEGEE
jgi:hypothetical protein